MIPERRVKLYSTITHSENFDPKKFFLPEIWQAELSGQPLRNVPFTEINETMTYVDQHRLLLDTADNVKTRNWVEFKNNEIIRKTNAGVNYVDIHNLNPENSDIKKSAELWESKQSKRDKQLRREKFKKSPEAIKLEIELDYLQKKESIEKYKEEFNLKSNEIQQKIKESMIRSGDYYRKNMKNIQKATTILKPISKFI